MLRNAFDRFNDYMVDTPFTFDDYLSLHRGIWTTYSSDVLRLTLQNPDIPMQEKYDNLEEVKIKYDRAVEIGDSVVLPIGFTYDMLRITNPNEFSSVLHTTGIMERSFHDNIKHRSVNEVVVTSEDSEF